MNSALSHDRVDETIDIPKRGVADMFGKKKIRNIGFTLVELLVVIAIIGVLIGIVAPAIQKALGNARRIACASNEKEIGLAIFLYCADHDQYYPTVDKYSNTSWDDYLAEYDGRNLKMSEIHSTRYSGANDNVVKGNSQLHKLYACPSDKARRDLMPPRVKRSYSLNQGSIDNSADKLGICRPNWGSGYTNEFAFSLFQVEKPADSIMLAEQHASNYVGAHATSVIRPQLVAEHDKKGDEFWGHEFGKMNFLMCDGHVVYMPYEATYPSETKDAWLAANDARDTMWDCVGR